MKSGRTLLLTAVAMLFVTTLTAMSAAQNAMADTPKIKASDFAWMTGRWIGHLPNGTAEQICSTPESGEMLCLFRVFVKGRPAMYELYTLNETPAGLELRSLQFSTDLTGKSLQQPMVMTLQKFGDKELVFAGAPGTEIATSSLFRTSPSTMNGVIIFKGQNAPHIQVRWEKVAYDAKVNYNSAQENKP